MNIILPGIVFCPGEWRGREAGKDLLEFSNFDNKDYKGIPETLGIYSK